MFRSRCILQGQYASQGFSRIVACVRICRDEILSVVLKYNCLYEMLCVVLKCKCRDEMLFVVKTFDFYIFHDEVMNFKRYSDFCYFTGKLISGIKHSRYRIVRLQTVINTYVYSF